MLRYSLSTDGAMVPAWGFQDHPLFWQPGGEENVNISGFIILPKLKVMLHIGLMKRH